MAVSDYARRRFDLLALQGASTLAPVILQQTLFGPQNAGQVCTGVQKLAQRWVLEFLTALGSMPFHMQTRGTDFVTQLQQGRLRTEYDVQSQFSFAELQIRQNLHNEDTADMPLDEQLARAELTELTISNLGIQLSITVVSRAGTSRAVILPIAITPANMRL